MGGYRYSFFHSEEDDPLRRHIRESMLGGLEFKIDPALQSMFTPPAGLAPYGGAAAPTAPGASSAAPQGGWSFNPLQAQPLADLRPFQPQPAEAGPQIDYSRPTPPASQTQAPSVRDLAKKAGIPSGLVNLVTPPPDLAEPNQDQEEMRKNTSPIDADAQRSTEKWKEIYKQRTGKDPLEFNLKFNIDEKGRFWFGL